MIGMVTLCILCWVSLQELDWTRVVKQVSVSALSWGQNLWCCITVIRCMMFRHVQMSGLVASERCICIDEGLLWALHGIIVQDQQLCERICMWQCSYRRWKVLEFKMYTVEAWIVMDIGCGPGKIWKVLTVRCSGPRILLWKVCGLKQKVQVWTTHCLVKWAALVLLWDKCVVNVCSVYTDNSIATSNLCD